MSGKGFVNQCRRRITYCLLICVCGGVVEPTLSLAFLVMMTSFLGNARRTIIAFARHWWMLDMFIPTSICIQIVVEKNVHRFQIYVRSQTVKSWKAIVIWTVSLPEIANYKCCQARNFDQFRQQSATINRNKTDLRPSYNRSVFSMWTTKWLVQKW